MYMVTEDDRLEVEKLNAMVLQMVTTLPTHGYRGRIDLVTGTRELHGDVGTGWEKVLTRSRFG